MRNTEVNTSTAPGSVFTCFGEGDEVACDELLEALVSVRERFPQDGLQPAEERHGVQTVEGEAAGELQQVGGHVDGSRRRVRHHVSIHGTVEGRCTREEMSSYQVFTLKQTLVLICTIRPF